MNLIEMPAAEPDYAKGGGQALPLIRGRRAGSMLELYVARALDRWKIPFLYQVLVGQRGTRGSAIVDFVVSNPFQQPVEIYGDYWHTGQLGADDKLKLAVEQRKFKRPTIILWGREIPDQESANRVVRERLV